MKMKKITAVLLCAAMIPFLFACKADETGKNVDVAEVGAAVSECYSGVDMIEVSADKLPMYVDGLDISKVEAVYASKAQAAFTDQFIIVKVREGEKTEDIKQMFRTYLDGLAEEYADYAPAEAQRATDGEIAIYGNYVVVIVSEDNDAVSEKVNEFFK